MFFNPFFKKKKLKKKIPISVQNLDLAYQNAVKYINIMSNITRKNQDKENTIRLRQTKLMLQVTFNRALLKLNQVGKDES